MVLPETQEHVTIKSKNGKRNENGLLFMIAASGVFPIIFRAWYLRYLLFYRCSLILYNK